MNNDASRLEAILGAGRAAAQAADFAEVADPERVLEPAPRVHLLAGALAFGREHAMVVGVALAVGLVFATMTFLRSRAMDVPMLVDMNQPASPAVSVTTPSSAPPLLKVHVIGAVVHPGVVAVASGARVEDAIAAAGGLTAQADPAQLNLAAVVNDGSQIVIGTKGAPQGDVNGPGGSGGSGGGALAKVNINTASDAQLQTVPGIGPVTAQKILQWRTQHGRFTTVAELQEIDGIGAKTLAQLEPYVQV